MAKRYSKCRKGFRYSKIHKSCKKIKRRSKRRSSKRSYKRSYKRTAGSDKGRYKRVYKGRKWSKNCNPGFKLNPLTKKCVIEIPAAGQANLRPHSSLINHIQRITGSPKRDAIHVAKQVTELAKSFGNVKVAGF